MKVLNYKEILSKFTLITEVRIQKTEVRVFGYGLKGEYFMFKTEYSYNQVANEVAKKLNNFLYTNLYKKV